MIVADRVTTIFMMPSGTTHRYSIRRGWLMFLLGLMLVLPVIGVIGAVMGWHVWQESRSLAVDNAELRQSLDKTCAEVARLEFAVRIAKEDAAKIRSGKKEMSDLSAVYAQEVDNGIVQIVNPVFRLIRPGEIRLIMEMYNRNQASPLMGRTIFSLRTSDGQVYPLAHEDTGFKIIRFKKFVIRATLPIRAFDLKGADIIVEVLTQGIVIFRHSYPLQS